MFFVNQFCREQDIDIFAITESWLQPSIPDSVINIQGYSLFRNDFPSSHPKYGVCLYIKDSIKAYQFNAHDPPPNTLTVFFPSFNIYVSVIYRPPAYDNISNLNLINYISSLSINKELILLGDFNLPTISWNQLVIDQHISPADSLFLDMFNTLGLQQWVNEPTYLRSDNILDLVLTSETDRVISVTLHPPFPHCDHCLVKFSYIFQGDYDDIDDAVTFLDWSRGKYSKIRQALDRYDWDLEFMNLNIDDTNAIISSLLWNLSSLYVPPRKPTKSSPPWHKFIPKNLFKQKSRFWEQYKHSRAQFGRNSYHALTNLSLFQQANIALRSSVLSAQRKYEENLISSRSSRPKLFHSYIRRKKQGRPKAGPLLINNVLTDDHMAMANIFADSFASVFSDQPLHNPFPHQTSDALIETIEFTISDVAQQLNSLNTDSAMGPDNIHPRLLKECSEQLAYPYYLLFKKSISAGCLPLSWKHSKVIPIYKKGHRTDPLNYRPISLTPIPCKILERIITKSLYAFLDDNSLFDDNQYGFRRGRSVTDQLLVTYNHVSYWYDQGHIVDLILFDYAKAFDKVHHLTMLDKLTSIGVSGNLFQWIRSFLINRCFFVSISACNSSPRPVPSGVPQGSVLGPLLFLLFINYVGSQLSCRYMIFADDLKLFLQCSSTVSGLASDELQHNINILSATSSSWGLEFSSSKCSHLRFSRPPTPAGVNLYFINNEPLITTVAQRDLGVMVDTNLKFHTHIRQVTAKAGGVASTILKSTVCRSPQFMFSTFTSDIRPILDFASPVWNTGYYGDLRLLESVQRRWTKQVQGMAHLNYAERLQRLQLHSIRGRLLRQDLIYCYKVFNGLTAVRPEDLFVRSPSVATRGHKFKIFIQQFQTEARKRSFSCRIAQLWNSLPSHVVEAPSVALFKNRLQETLGNDLYTFID